MVELKHLAELAAKDFEQLLLLSDLPDAERR
jgi:hypothetical protein